MLDMKTLMVTYAVNSLLNTFVMIMYWKQNRKFVTGISEWAVALIMQTSGFLLLSSKGVLPDIISTVISNILIAAASIVMLIGFTKFVHHKVREAHNFALLAIYAMLQCYFTFIHDSTSIRIIMISLFVSIMFIQSAFLLIISHRHEMIAFIKVMGYICLLYVGIQFCRITIELVEPTQDYFSAGKLATASQIANQFLTIVMVFTFIISVNSVNLDKRLKRELQLELKDRELREFLDKSASIEYWQKTDGTIEYISPSILRITGYDAQDFFDNPNLFTDIIHPDCFKYNLHLILQDKAKIEYRIIDKSGHVHWVERVSNDIYDDSNGIKGWHVTIQDITEKIEFEEKLKNYNTQLERDVSEKLEEIAAAHRSSVYSLAKITESRDKLTGNHIERVQHLCRALAEQLRTVKSLEKVITPVYIDNIFYASILHDIGKVGIADSILLKPGKLTAEEYELVKTHVEIGAKALEVISASYSKNHIIDMAIDIARFHHEKWDGTGYMRGLSKEEIPLSARIMAIVDAYDVIRTARPYKTAKTHSDAVNTIRLDSGKHFDPLLVDVFIKSHGTFEEIYNTWMDENITC